MDFWDDDPRGAAGFWAEDPRGPGAAAPPRRQRRVRRRRRRAVVGAIAVVVVALSGLVALATGALGAEQSTSTPPTNPDRTAVDVATKELDLSEIEARVDPAVVDVTSELPGGEAAGTGMVITSDGEILTNNHVIEGATKITVTIGDEKKSHTAEVLGTAPFDDVALLKVKGVSGLDTVEIGDASGLAVGERVIAIGNALNLPGPPRVTEGTVTALDQSITVGDDRGNSEDLKNLIQTSTELSPGNSGGPLVDAQGAVVGINAAAEIQGRRLSTGDQSSDVGFAIPIDHAMDIAKQIERGDETRTVHIGPTGYMGVQVRDAGLDNNGFPNGRGRPGTPTTTGDGALVIGVVPNGPADDAGIAAGDTLTAIDGVQVTSSSELGDRIRAHEPGDDVTITYLDDAGTEHTASVHLIGNPAA